MKKLLCIFLSFCSLYANSQSNPALADTLAKMVIADQQAAGLPPGNNFTPEWQLFKDSIFASHHQRLEKLFAHNGFPGYDKVGTEGSKNFWLLTQHLDKWPAFQQQVLTAMEKEVAKKNASSRDFALLADRVRLNTGRLQLYGTQLTYDTDSCQAKPRPLENPESVNERRKQMGLEPIESYLNSMSEMHFMMNKASYEQRGIKGPKLYPIK